MDRAKSYFIGRSSSAERLRVDQKDEFQYLLPVSTLSHKHRIEVRTLLGHCLYRRVLLWALAIFTLFGLVFFKTTAHAPTGKLANVDDFRLENGGTGGTVGTVQVPVRPWDKKSKHHQLHGQSPKKKEQAKKEPPKKEVLNQVAPKKTPEETPRVAKNQGDNSEEVGGLHWLKFRHLNGIFFGINAIVPVAKHSPEYPNPTLAMPVPTTEVFHNKAPTQTPYKPHPNYSSEEYTSEYHPVKECFLDREDTVPVPDLYAYDGIPQHHPNPAIGSHSVLGLRDDICFDRWGRYGPYGLGYEASEGGIGEGMDSEGAGKEVVWSKTGKTDYSRIDWGDAQERCHDRNQHRFQGAEDKTTATPYEQKFLEAEDGHAPQQLLPRTAVVVRTYVGFTWTRLAILNFRAMIAELALKSGGEYTVHFLLHVKKNDAPIWSDPEAVRKILDDNVPAEFHSLCTLWSEAEMRLYYPGGFGDPVANPSGMGIYGVYRSAHMPLQVFAMKHPQYAHFWNWEMDMRYVGNYYELFDRLGAWARAQSRDHLWERSARYYIPSVHGDWANFSAVARAQTKASGRAPVLGPVLFSGKMTLRAEEQGVPVMPAGCAKGDNLAGCGVGEEADLVTLNPLFDADESGWVFASDVTGYGRDSPPPPRRCAIVTASRLSRRLLSAMHEEVWRLRHSMFSEMFPASVALHRGLKAAYAPHPVFLDRGWQPFSEIDAHFNGGRDGSSGGRGSPFDLRNEHNHKGTSWYYDSEFAGLLWRRWLGFAQMDGRGGGGGRSGQGTLRGGPEEEAREGSSGRMCLRSMLVHPIKFENPAEKRYGLGALPGNALLRKGY